MKQFTANKAPEDMFTKARLKKMGLSPISDHSAFITYPQVKDAISYTSLRTHAQLKIMQDIPYSSLLKNQTKEI